MTITTTVVSRRSLLGVGACAALAAATGCSVDTGGSTTAAAGRDIVFPDYPTQLTSEQTRLRWVDSGDVKGWWIGPTLEAFQTKHPNYEVTYDGAGWATVNQVVPLGIRNGSAHDVFQLPQGTEVGTAVSEGWIAPLDDVIPELDTWRAEIEQHATLLPGRHIFDGKIYSFPLASNKRLRHFLQFSSAVMAEAGYDDPVAQITTWEEWHSALTAVVKTGKSGLAVGEDQLAVLVGFLANSIGWRGSSPEGMDSMTGRYILDAPEVLEALEFVRRLATDGLLVPGYVTTKAADLRAQMPAGTIGMISNGPWDIPIWKQDAPDWKYAMAPLPSRDGTEYHVPFTDLGAQEFYVYAKSTVASAAGQILRYMSSLQGQTEMVIMTQGNVLSMNEEANRAAQASGALDPQSEVANGIADAVLRAAPIPQVRNPDTGLVVAAQKAPKPGLREIMQGILSGEVTDAGRALSDLNAKSNAAREKALATARQQGAQVSAEDFAFGNWDPSKDYTKADYEALG